MNVHNLATEFFKKAQDFRQAYNKRMADKGMDQVAEKYAKIADMLDKGYSFITDMMARESREEFLEAQNKALADRCEFLKGELDKWERAHQYFSDIKTRNKIEELDEWMKKKTGEQINNDTDRIRACKKILEQ